MAAYRMGPKTRVVVKRPFGSTLPYAEPGRPGSQPDATFTRGPAAAQGALAPPVDPIYDAQVGGAQRNRALTEDQVSYQRGQLGQTYGFGMAANGVVVSDPSNPFSLAAAMQKSYDQRRKGNSVGFAARGQLYSGALQNQQNAAAMDYERRRDALMREFGGANARLTGGGLQAGADFDDAVTQAGADRIDRALRARLDPSAVPAPSTPVPAARAKLRVPRKRLPRGLG